MTLNIISICEIAITLHLRCFEGMLTMFHRLAVALAASLVTCVIATSLAKSETVEPATACGKPLQADSDWQTAEPEDSAVDEATLCLLNETLDKIPR